MNTKLPTPLYLGDWKIREQLPANLVDLPNEAVWSSTYYAGNSDTLNGEPFGESGTVSILEADSIIPYLVGWKKTSPTRGVREVVLDSPKITLPILKALANAGAVSITL